MEHILSIQSHVAYGYVGNRAATFPLQRLGFDVSVINTVQFSNHTGYGEWQGDIFSKSHILDIFNGIASLGVIQQYGALLTGYLGSADIGETISTILDRLRHENPKVIYCCDPVIGDVGRGVFVRPGVGEFIRRDLIEFANIITPNQFELNYLTDQPLNSLDDINKACAMLHDRGPETVLVTSVTSPDIPKDKIGIYLHIENRAFLALTPKLDFAVQPNGAGDATAALFLGQLLKTGDPMLALSKTAEAVYAIFRSTYLAKSRELQLIQSQAYFDADEFVSSEIHTL